MEFILYSIALILLFLLFIPVMRENGISLRNGVEVIFFGIQISVIIVPAVCLIIFSLQRLNSLKLNRNFQMFHHHFDESGARVVG